MNSNNKNIYERKESHQTKKKRTPILFLRIPILRKEDRKKHKRSILKNTLLAGVNNNLSEVCVAIAKYCYQLVCQGLSERPNDSTLTEILKEQIAMFCLSLRNILNSKATLLTLSKSQKNCPVSPPHTVKTGRRVILFM